MPNTYHYTEDSYEQTILDLFNEMGYEVLHGPDVDAETGREMTDATIPGKLREVMLRINGSDKTAAVDEAIRKIHELFSQPLVPANVQMTDWLQNGLDVTFKTGEGTLRSDHVRILDIDNPANNSFQVANQWTVINGQAKKRADIVVFLNGLPIAVIELKSPSREVTNSEEAYLQLQNYMRQVPQLFIVVQMLIISDMADTQVGTITAPLDRFMEWKTTDGSYESTAIADFQTFFEGIFDKSLLIDLIADFSLSMGSDTKKARILAGYHQYFAVKKAMRCTQDALGRKDSKIGVFWHTQGSGKSLSMVFYAHQLLKNLLSATILVLTDRLDLNDQLHSTFAACSDYLRQTPVKATDGDHLYELLENRKSHGIIFANIQKFKDRKKPITMRSDVIVMSDEAHRSQSNIKTKVDTATGEIKLGFAAIVRKLIPNAAFIGFTGTPIEADDNDTREVFGNYIDIYDMTQAVEDGVTVPVYYESRLIQLNLDEEALRLLDREYDKLAEEGAEEEDIKRSKQENAQLHALLHAPETIDTLCRDIIDHYEANRQDHLTGKAMIVALDRATGIEIYKRLVELRPQWKDIIGVVMTQGNQDPAEWNDIIGSAAHKQELARQFKDNDSAMKIAIVVDMWLTGFDVPSLATMYVYKPMKGHNLMQAIARVNRVFPEKSGGLVVDYIGIAQALKKAMHDYTNRDKKRFGDPDIKKTAYQEFLASITRCRECMNGYDYSGFAACSNLQRANLIKGGVNVLLDPNNIVSTLCDDNVTKYDAARKLFVDEGKRLAQATTLCRSLLTPAEKFEEAYFEAVRTLLVRLTSNKKITRKIIDDRITNLLKVAVKADGVVEILSTQGTEFNLFDEKFLKEVAEMKEKNLALELLKRLLEQHIRKHAKKNMTQADKFSEMLDARLAEYLRGLISNEEVIQELLKMAQELKAHAEQASELGLTEEEQAFYDALTRPQAVKDFYENDTLVAMAKELTEALRNSKTIDWRQKESARANMRRMVKRLLKKYKYPPEEQEKALENVIKQCELYADSDDVETPDKLIKPYQVSNSDFSIAAEPFEVYKWQEIEQTVQNEFSRQETILIGCYRDRKHLEWILDNHIYNIRLGRRKGSMENHHECIEAAERLYLYDVNNTSKVYMFRISGNKEMTGAELESLYYPRKSPGKCYMTFTIEETDCSKDNSIPMPNIKDILDQLPNHINGAPVFIESNNHD